VNGEVPCRPGRHAAVAAFRDRWATVAWRRAIHGHASRRPARARGGRVVLPPMRVVHGAPWGHLLQDRVADLSARPSACACVRRPTTSCPQRGSGKVPVSRHRRSVVSPRQSRRLRIRSCRLNWRKPSLTTRRNFQTFLHLDNNCRDAGKICAALRAEVWTDQPGRDRRQSTARQSLVMIAARTGHPCGTFEAPLAPQRLPGVDTIDAGTTGPQLITPERYLRALRRRPRTRPHSRWLKPACMSRGAPAPRFSRHCHCRRRVGHAPA